mmetsp:Transcript_22060/g.55618  ORF Transcript_22060/g.55618 Transcript_22060/m.55618 type:complete len:249 (-) Transcript_22060:99-845(-)
MGCRRGVAQRRVLATTETLGHESNHLLDRRATARFGFVFDVENRVAQTVEPVHHVAVLERTKAGVTLQKHFVLVLIVHKTRRFVSVNSFGCAASTRSVVTGSCIPNYRSVHSDLSSSHHRRLRSLLLHVDHSGATVVNCTHKNLVFQLELEPRRKDAHVQHFRVQLREFRAGNARALAEAVILEPQLLLVDRKVVHRGGAWGQLVVVLPARFSTSAVKSRIEINLQVARNVLQQKLLPGASRRRYLFE